MSVTCGRIPKTVPTSIVSHLVLGSRWLGFRNSGLHAPATKLDALALTNTRPCIATHSLRSDPKNVSQNHWSPENRVHYSSAL